MLSKYIFDDFKTTTTIYILHNMHVRSSKFLPPFGVNMNYWCSVACACVPQTKFLQIDISA
jgi:hypothetical protein